VLTGNVQWETQWEEDIHMQVNKTFAKQTAAQTFSTNITNLTQLHCDCNYWILNVIKAQNTVKPLFIL